MYPTFPPLISVTLYPGTIALDSLINERLKITSILQKLLKKCLTAAIAVQSIIILVEVQLATLFTDL